VSANCEQRQNTNAAAHFCGTDGGDRWLNFG
jgi:hypothetical protein